MRVDLLPPFQGAANAPDECRGMTDSPSTLAAAKWLRPSSGGCNPRHPDHFARKHVWFLNCLLALRSESRDCQQENRCQPSKKQLSWKCSKEPFERTSRARMLSDRCCPKTSIGNP